MLTALVLPQFQEFDSCHVDKALEGKGFKNIVSDELK
jgi:hypothetical protein